MNLKWYCLGVVCKFSRGGWKGEQADISDSCQNQVLVTMQPLHELTFDAQV